MRAAREPRTPCCVPGSERPASSGAIARSRRSHRCGIGSTCHSRSTRSPRRCSRRSRRAIRYAAMDNPRTVRAYKLALQLDPEAFDATQLNAYAGVLDEVGDYTTCEAIGKRLLAAAGDDLMWKTNAWNHIACALCGQVRFNEA